MEAVSTSLSVLYVEDDERLARLTARYLESHGVRVTVVGDGEAGVREALRIRPDVILLDLMLPGVDGREACRRLRARVDTPIIMVTALGEESDRVLGLEGGADDYVAKPFSSRELLARIRAQARRARGQAGPAEQAISVGPLHLDRQSMRATMRGREMSLTTYEFGLLRALAAKAGRVFSREQLLDLVRGSAEESFDRSIDVHISHLRQKLGDDPRNPRFLKTVRGVGYMLAVPA
jgi:DNA-binding response OmpR family regulator